MEENISDRVINTLPENASIFVALTFNSKPLKIIDISKFLSSIPNLDTNLTIYQALCLYMTDLIYDGYTDKVGYKQKTLNILDPIATPNVDTIYGNITQPSTFGNPDDQPFCRDLVITLNHDLNPSNCLVSVNGTFHRVIKIDDNRIGVVDGYLNMSRSQQKSVLLVNTDQLGGHDIIDINPENILNFDELSHKLYLRYDNADLLKDYTVFACIDGNLLTPLHQAYTVLNSKTITLDLKHIDFIKQIRHNPNQMRYKTKPSLSIKPPFKSIVNDKDLTLFVDSHITRKDYLQSEDFIKNRVTSSQSFLVAIKNKQLFLTKRNLVSRKNLRRYEYFGSTTPNGIFYFNGIHQIPYTLVKNEAISILPPSVKAQLKEIYILPSYAFYVHPFKGADDSDAYTLKGEYAPSISMDLKHFDSPHSYMIEVSSYLKN